jgi:hypothetical protein
VSSGTRASPAPGRRRGSRALRGLFPRRRPSSLPLPLEQATRLAELPPATRDQILGWLATGDLILASEARKFPAPPMARPGLSQSLPEVLRRIREDPTFPAMAASGLARELGDEKSYSGFLARCTEAWGGARYRPRDWSLRSNRRAGPRRNGRGRCS